MEPRGGLLAHSQARAERDDCGCAGWGVAPHGQATCRPWLSSSSAPVTMRLRWSLSRPRVRRAAEPDQIVADEAVDAQTAQGSSARRRPPMSTTLLLRSRLRPPRLRVPLVHRDRTISRLLCSEAPLVVVASPGGYGKTVALGQWLEVDPRTTAWLQADPSDDDPLLLLHCLVAALADVVASCQSAPTWSGTTGPSHSLCGSPACSIIRPRRPADGTPTTQTLTSCSHWIPRWGHAGSS
jgi:hypothetical protein